MKLPPTVEALSDRQQFARRNAWESAPPYFDCPKGWAAQLEEFGVLYRFNLYHWQVGEINFWPQSGKVYVVGKPTADCVYSFGRLMEIIRG